MEAFGVQFHINDEQRFGELCSLYAEIKHDKDAGKFRDPAEWVALVPDRVKANFEWPTAEERERWVAVRDSTVIAVPESNEQLGAKWDFYRAFEAFEAGEYLVLDCVRVGESVGELRIDPCFGYPYGGVGPLIALAEAFGFEITGVNECGRFETRAELLGHKVQDKLTLRRTGPAVDRSWFARLFGRGPGR